MTPVAEYDHWQANPYTSSTYPLQTTSQHTEENNLCTCRLLIVLRHNSHPPGSTGAPLAQQRRGVFAPTARWCSLSLSSTGPQSPCSWYNHLALCRISPVCGEPHALHGTHHDRLHSPDFASGWQQSKWFEIKRLRSDDASWRKLL